MRPEPAEDVTERERRQASVRYYMACTTCDAKRTEPCVDRRKTDWVSYAVGDGQYRVVQADVLDREFHKARWDAWRSRSAVEQLSEIVDPVPTW